MSMRDRLMKTVTDNVQRSGLLARLRVKWQNLFRRIFASKPKRLELKLATYSEAEGLLKQGWTLAPEEDRNRAFGLVYLERLDSPSHGHPKT